VISDDGVGQEPGGFNLGIAPQENCTSTLDAPGGAESSRRGDADELGGDALAGQVPAAA